MCVGPSPRGELMPGPTRTKEHFDRTKKEARVFAKMQFLEQFVSGENQVQTCEVYAYDYVKSFGLSPLTAAEIIMISVLHPSVKWSQQADNELVRFQIQNVVRMVLRGVAPKKWIEENLTEIGLDSLSETAT